MKTVAVAFVVAFCSGMLTLGIAAAWRREAGLEARLSALETRLRSGEEEIRLLKEKEASAATRLRACVARGDALVGRLREIDEKGRRAAGDDQHVSRSELDEVVSAVNELVDTVDGLTAAMDARPQAAVLQQLGNGTLTADSLSLTPEGALLLSRGTGDPGFADTTARLWIAENGAVARDLLDVTRVMRAASDRSSALEALSQDRARAQTREQAVEEAQEQAQEAPDSEAAAPQE